MRRLPLTYIIKLLISFIEDPKYCNIALSIIADACLEKTFLFEVIRHGGIKSLIRIMKNIVSDEIQNRICRALGNIAKSEVGLKEIITMKPIANILQFLSGTTDKNCQQTAVRTLRILGRDSKSRDTIVKENGIIYIAQLLNSPSKEVLLCSTKALAELSENCTISCARQMLEMQYLKILVELYSHSEKDIRMHALTSLKNLSVQEEIRSNLIKVGAVKLFTEVAMDFESFEMSRIATLALCSCLDHIHMWNNYGVPRHNGLKAIVEVLKRKNFEDIHIHIVSSLLPLCYENAGSKILFELEIIQVLIQNLKNFIFYNKVDHSIPVFQLTDYMIKNEIPTPPPLKVKSISNDKFNINSTTYCNSKVLSLSTDKNIKRAKFDNKNSCLDFEYFSKQNSLKSIKKFDNNSLNFHSSGASSQCSPTSSGSNTSTSPKYLYDINVNSPVANLWAAHSNSDEKFWCWSPVIYESEMSEISEMGTESSMESKNEDNSNTSDKNILSSYDNSVFSSSFEEINVEQMSDIIPGTPSKKRNLTNISENTKECPFSKKQKTDIIVQISLDEYTGNEKMKTPLKCSETSKVQTSIIRFEKSAIDHYVLALLNQLSFHVEKKSNSEFASISCFSVLMDYMCSIQNPNPKAEKVLLNLVRNRYCFEKLIVSGFVTEMEKRIAIVHDPEKCSRCMQINITYHTLLSAFRKEAESDFGIGTLCRILSTGGKLSQLNAIHAVSKLILVKASMYKLIIQANGLSLLLSFITESSKTVCSNAVLCLCQLYQNLKTMNVDKNLEKCCFSGTCSIKVVSTCAYKGVIETATDVTFYVNEINILACRDTICKNSEYFTALLKGHFSEKNKNIIVMTNVSAETLTTLFHFLHGCKTDSSCPYIKRIPFSILLELLSECDKYLLNDVKTFVEDQLCHNLHSTTVYKIYEAAKNYNSSKLIKRTVDYILSMDVTQKDDLISCFQELLNLGEDFNFLNDVTSLIQNMFPEWCSPN
ncbi:armadillo repeat-containing protein 5 [Trichonephila clavata]|uniref:Armadillo repeat-containing protein 5 n=1 Tax=Trichonephila clavata TaxID=2740835 RepID=A0A8X6IWI9_TRICU|nr:armadillo repeat-containing protein 5 [Trichonephila clavata]